MVKMERANVRDFPRIMPLAFALQAYEASVEPAVKVTPRTKRSLEGFVRKNLKRKDARFFMALEGGEVVGYVSGWLSKSSISASGRPYGYVSDAFVAEGFRGKGVGRRLVAELMRWFRERGVEYVEVYTYVANAAGKGFWESEGFRPNMVRYLLKAG